MTHTGKVALITGASKGIGAAAVREFAAAGIKVGMLARSAQALGALADELKQQGHECLGLAADVSDNSQVKAAADTLAKAFGPVDYLVNNAGLIDPIGLTGDLDPADWAKVIDVNVKGPLYATHAVLPGMVARGAGVVLNISSGAASSALAGWSHYCASKAALFSMTRCLDVEYGDKGVRVLGLSPGTVATDMQVSIKSSGINAVSQLDPSVHISPEWVAKTMLWLCGPRGAGYAGQDFQLRTEENKRLIGLI